MKKRILSTTALVMCFATWLFAQNPTPNAGFENWTMVGNHYDPNNWNTLNPSTAVIGVFTCTRVTGANAHGGTYAIKLTTKSVFGVTANGIASTAQLITTPPYGVTGGIPYTQRPDSITGWYKYTPATPADSGFVQFVLEGSASDTVGLIRFSTPNDTVATYTRFSAPIAYFSPGNPANSYWILSSSDGVNPVVNSAIFIDDIALVFNSTGINDLVANVPLEVQNSLVNDVMYLSNNTTHAATFRLFDASGKRVLVQELQPGASEIAASGLNAGIYFYQITGVSTSDQVTGKLFKY